MKKLISLLICFTSLVATANNIQKGVELFENKNYYGARKFFTEFVQQNKENAEAYYYLGRIDFEEKKYNNAIDNFDLSIEKAPKNYLFYFWRGRTNLVLLMEANMMMKAVYSSRTLNDFERAVELNPQDLESRIYLAEYYGQAPAIAGGSNNKSIIQFRTALNMHPQVPYLYQGLGNQYRTVEKYDSAFHFYKKGLEKDPQNSMILYEIGKTAVYSGKELMFAETSLKKSIEIGMDKWHQGDAYYLLGCIYEKTNKKDQAKSAFQECLKLNVEHSECKKALKKYN